VAGLVSSSSSGSSYNLTAFDIFGDCVYWSNAHRILVSSTSNVDLRVRRVSVLVAFSPDAIASPRLLNCSASGELVLNPGKVTEEDLGVEGIVCGAVAPVLVTQGLGAALAALEGLLAPLAAKAPKDTTSLPSDRYHEGQDASSSSSSSSSSFVDWDDFNGVIGKPHSLLPLLSSATANVSSLDRLLPDSIDLLRLLNSSSSSPMIDV
jgi:hypothetical protein